MTTLRLALALLVVLLCSGFVPLSGCAKGCGSAGRSGARLGRVGTYSDDLARGLGRGGHYADDLARTGTYQRGMIVPGPALATHTDDLAQLSRVRLDERLAALPEADGAVHQLARQPASGRVVGGLDDTGRTFGKDYARSIDDLAISERQHEQLMDAFEKAQDLAENVIEALEDDDEASPEAASVLRAARQRVQLVAIELEADLGRILSPAQQARFGATLGAGELLIYRIARDRPVHRTSDKVAP